MEGLTSDDNSDFNPDDPFSMICGDLGLGENSRSSASLRYELEALNDADVLPTRENERLAQRAAAAAGKGYSNDINNYHRKSRSSSIEECISPDKIQARKKSFSNDKIRRRSSTSSNTCVKPGDGENNCGNEYFPTYADVPYGTSLRQQKKLYEQNLGSIIKKHTCSVDGDTPTNETGKKTLSSEEIDKKLLSAVEEVEELKQDLEICKQRLDAKYNAITILKKQAEENNHEHVTNELKAKETSLKLAESGDSTSLVVAQCGLNFGETPRETLQRRYLRVCQENALLTAQLEARSEELRRANSHKVALRQERDELLALLDIKERKKYEKSHSELLEEEEFSDYTTTELAVLGACRCRGTGQTEPCGCAYAAANLMREVCKLREECRQMLQRREEAYMTVDAYRIAFEEQLQKSRTMTQQLASLSTLSSRAVKAKAAVKWLLAVLADDEYPPAKSHDGDATKIHDKSSLEALTLPELVTLLTEMLHEKKEALAHQKLAGQILSSRLQESERKLQSLTEADGDVYHS